MQSGLCNLGRQSRQSKQTGKAGRQAGRAGQAGRQGRQIVRKFTANWAGTLLPDGPRMARYCLGALLGRLGGRRQGKASKNPYSQAKFGEFKLIQ